MDEQYFLRALATLLTEWAAATKFEDQESFWDEALGILRHGIKSGFFSEIASAKTVRELEAAAISLAEKMITKKGGMAASRHLATRQFIKRLAQTLYTSSPVKNPPALMVLGVGIAVASTASGAQADPSKLSAQWTRYQIYLANYLLSMSVHVSANPDRFYVNEPSNFAQWARENKH